MTFLKRIFGRIVFWLLCILVSPFMWRRWLEAIEVSEFDGEYLGG